VLVDVTGGLVVGDVEQLLPAEREQVELEDILPGVMGLPSNDHHVCAVPMARARHLICPAFFGPREFG